MQQEELFHYKVIKRSFKAQSGATPSPPPWSETINNLHVWRTVIKMESCSLHCRLGWENETRGEWRRLWMAVWGGKPVDVSSALNSSIPMWRVQKGVCVESGGWGYGWIFKWGYWGNHDSIIRWKEESLEKRNNKNNDTLQRFHTVITQSPFSSHYSASLTFLKMTSFLMNHNVCVSTWSTWCICFHRTDKRNVMIFITFIRSNFDS